MVDRSSTELDLCALQVDSANSHGTGGVALWPDYYGDKNRRRMAVL